nr:hypothetical protein [Tanacetum cinerariifolium]
KIGENLARINLDIILVYKNNYISRPKKYSELSATEAIQADCDVKATNIILQGLPPEVYALVSNHKITKELWEIIQLLMQGTSLTKQERECKLYDNFDKFAYKNGETLRDFYLRFSLLLNDMNIYNMKLEEFQVNTKFLNTLPPEWSKFVTDVKLSPQYGSPYQSQQYSNNQSSISLSITYPSNDYQSSVHHNIYSPSSSIPQLEYAPTVNQQPEFPQPDSGLIVPVFKQGDDPIDAINHMMSFISFVITSRYPTTNNQLRNSSNPRQHATINEGIITLQPVQGRKTSFASSTSRTYTPGASGNNSGKQKTVNCYNCKGEGHMSKQCSKPKRKWDDSWFKDKVLLVQAQANGQILYEEKLAFLADLEISEGQATQTVHNPDNVDTNLINPVVHAMPSSEQSNVVNHSETEITSNSNIIPYSQEIALEKQIKQPDNIVFKRDQSAQTVHMLTKPQFFYDHTTRQALAFQNPFYLKKAQLLEPKLYDEPTLSSRPTKVEVPKELPKVSMVNTSLKKLKHHLASFDVVIKERTTATATTEGSWGFEHTKACFRDEIILFIKALKDLFNIFDQYLIDELSEVQNIFHQMEQAVEQHRVESKTFEVKMNKVLNENERLLEQVISKDIVYIIVNSFMDNPSVKVHECEKCLKLETELLNKKDFIEKEIYDKLFRNYTTLEKHCISLEVDTQLNQEIFQRDNSVSNQSAPSFDQLFDINELKAQSQEKDTVIKKLKERIKSLSGNMKDDKIRKDLEEIKTLWSNSITT